MLEDQRALASTVVLPRHRRQVLGDPLHGHTAVTAVSTSHRNLGHPNAFLDQETRLLELENTRICDNTVKTKVISFTRWQYGVVGQSAGSQKVAVVWRAAALLPTVAKNRWSEPYTGLEPLLVVTGPRPEREANVQKNKKHKFATKNAFRPPLPRRLISAKFCMPVVFSRVSFLVLSFGMIGRKVWIRDRNYTLPVDEAHRLHKSTSARQCPVPC